MRNAIPLSPVPRSAIAILILLLLQACSPGNDLTREAAREILTTSGDFPREVLGRFSDDWIGSYAPSSSKTAFSRKFEELTESGLATYTETRERGGVAWFTVLRISLTEEGLVYARSEEKRYEYASAHGLSLKTVDVVTRTIEFGEVTGISYTGEDRVVALVEFTEIHTLTPFGRLSGFFPKEKEGTVDKVATFRLYDDGWRVVE